MSMIEAPFEIMLSRVARRVDDVLTPPSENESGVTFRMPITLVLRRGERGVKERLDETGVNEDRGSPRIRSLR
jgi:hypothetical protein